MDFERVPKGAHGVEGVMVQLRGDDEHLYWLFVDAGYRVDDERNIVITEEDIDIKKIVCPESGLTPKGETGEPTVNGRLMDAVISESREVIRERLEYRSYSKAAAAADSVEASYTAKNGGIGVYL